MEADVVTINQVICPVDLSDASATALRHAAAWARWYEAPLRVLHVAAPPEVVVSGTGQAAVIPARPSHLVSADVDRFIAAALPDEPVPAMDLEVGDPVDTIVEVSTRRPGSLLVMGTHGLSGLDRVLLGSVTERVSHRVACPLLVVPPRDTAGPAAGIKLERILCAVDFHPSSLAGLRYALSLAQESRCRLELVTVLERARFSEWSAIGRPHVPPDDQGRRAMLLHALRERVPDDARQWCLVREDVLTGSPADALLERADEVGAELIVLGTGDRYHLHALWLGSTAGRLMQSARCPVLIVPGPKRMAVHARPLPRSKWGMALERLSLAHQGEPTSIAIMLAKADGTRLTHVIANPQDVRLSEAQDQHDIELFIVGRDGSTTLLGVGGSHL
jgi:nucleotide-binding universal stress UspA family protein